MKSYIAKDLLGIHILACDKPTLEDGIYSGLDLTESLGLTNVLPNLSLHLGEIHEITEGDWEKLLRQKRAVRNRLSQGN